MSADLPLPRPSRRTSRARRVTGGLARHALYDVFPALPLMERLQAIRQRAAVAALRAAEDVEVDRAAAALGTPPSAAVAVVMATYRRPVGLARAIRSVLDQELQDLVVIVVDDGGGLPDALPDDPRVHAVSLARNYAVLGLVRNVGIRLTSSDRIAILDDDNTWTPQHLPCSMAAHAAGADLTYTAVEVRDVGGRVLRVLERPFARAALRHKNYVDSNSLVVRRRPDVLFSRQVRANPSWRKEDWELVYRLSATMRVQALPDRTVHYLQNPDSYYSIFAR